MARRKRKPRYTKIGRKADPTAPFLPRNQRRSETKGRPIRYSGYR